MISMRCIGPAIACSAGLFSPTPLHASEPAPTQGRFSTEAIENIRVNRDTTEWGENLARQHYGPSAMRLYEGVSDEELRAYIPDLTPFRSVFCPDHPVRRWYNWRFEAPDRIYCLDDPSGECFHVYNPDDTTEDWNPQGRLRFDRVQHVIGSVVNLAVSYRLDGNQRHGEQAAVIVRRFAEAWPRWKIKLVNRWTFHDEPRASAGRLGSWYIADGMALGQIAEAYGLLKGTGLLSEDDDRFIRENLFDEAIAFFQHPDNHLGFKSGNIGNDEPAIYTGIAKIAVATDNKELAEWVIAEVAEIYNPDRGMFHADGFWYEGAMNYHMMSMNLFLDFPQVLHGYNGFDAFRDPRFEGMTRALQSPVWFMWADGSSPPTNDGHRSDYSHNPPPPKFHELLFHATGDVEMLAMAQHLARLQGMPSWQSDISLLFPPLPQMDLPTPGPLPSHLFGDMGYVHLRHGTDIKKQMAVTLIHSSMVPHGHFDNNAILLFAHGHEMAMDLGYMFEQYTRGWATTTLGHNTVTVNRSEQQRVEPPRPVDVLFSMLNKPIQAVETDGAMVYDETSMYRRLIATIPINEEEAYVFDVFRVRGGEVHDWRLQSNGESMEITGVNGWSPWPAADEYGVTYYGRVLADGPSPLQDAQFASPRGVWRAEWNVAPDDRVAYRVHVVPQEGDQVVRASVPAARDYNRTDIDARMPGLMIHREGPDSVFVAVHEPIKGEAAIASVAAMDVTSACPTAVALRIELVNGSSHLLFSTCSDDARMTIQVDGLGEIIMQGRFGAVLLDASNAPFLAAVGGGTTLRAGGIELKAGTDGNALHERDR